MSKNENPGLRIQTPNDDNKKDGVLPKHVSTLGFPSAPDGGWGWVVVAASFVIFGICDGISFSFGIIYIDLLSAFGESKSLTSLVGSLFVGVPLICGPLASALVTKFGCRTMTIIGGLISSAGFMLSYFANSIISLCVVLGLIVGIGLSFCYVTSVIIVAFYFERKRALATGLSVCGTGFGTFLLAPFIDMLIKNYGWRGTMLALGGLMLNVVVCGFLYIPLKFSPGELEKRKRRLSLKRTLILETSIERSKYAKVAVNKINVEQPSQSTVMLPTYTDAYYVAQISPSVVKQVRKDGTHLEQDLQKLVHNLTFVEGLNQSVIPSNEIQRQREQASSFSQNHRDMPDELLLRYVVDYMPLFRKDVYYRGNLLKLHGAHHRTSSCPEFYTLLDGTHSSTKRGEMVISFYQVVRRVMLSMFDVEILRHPLFCVFAVSNFILYLWYDVPYLFIGDHATGLGVTPRKASLIVSLIGIVNTAGQIIYGCVGDLPINLTLLYTVSSILLGFSVLAVPLYDSYWYMCLMTAIFGFLVSCNYSLTTVILVQYLGLDKLTHACGLLMLIQGLANLCGPPLAGHISDLTGSYDASFYTAGVCVIFSGLVMFLVPCLQKSMENNDGSTDLH